ncbi:cupin domain-containing protein [Siccibacter turicensis]|uniref:cupin domain-containing protein n=1 Tax=Siccibacter turicensis TaxID=357233 RepID=UPI003F54DE2F
MKDYVEIYAIKQPCGGVPNNSLPLLIYPGAAVQATGDLADWFEQCFERNDWPPRWRYPIFTYTHFHSNTHEVLGVYQGSAQVQFGGEAGPVLTLKQGDAVLIPAGVGHKQIAASQDFMAVGAYPRGFSPDKCLDKPEQRDAMQRNAERVPLPDSDPLLGERSGINTHWRHQGRGD